MSSSYSLIHPANPGKVGFPHGLPIELAMGLNPVKDICIAYGVSRDGLAEIMENPSFKALFEFAEEQMALPGGQMRLKSLLVSEEVPEVLYKIIHDTEAPAAARVRAATLITNMAGVISDKPADTGPTATIHINLSSGPAAATHYGVTYEVQPVPRIAKED